MKKIAALVILVAVVATAQSSAGYQDGGSVIKQIDATTKQIEDMELKILEAEENKSHAHSMATSARKLGLADDHEVVRTAKEIWHENDVEHRKLSNELAAAQNNLKALQARKVFVGSFKLTGYCPCYACSEGYGTRTASGAKATDGITVAADTRKLPLGTRIYIEGVGERVVQDVGGAVKGNKIDIYVSNHAACYTPAYNQSSAKVYILK